MSLARERPRQFQIAPRCGIDSDGLRGSGFFRARKVLEIALLRQLNVIEQSAERRDLAARKIAEARQILHIVKRLHAATGIVTIKAAVGLRNKFIFPSCQRFK